MGLALGELRAAVCGTAAEFEPATLDRAAAVAAVQEWSASERAAAAGLALTRRVFSQAVS
jgi:hypothetical protein